MKLIREIINGFFLRLRMLLVILGIINIAIGVYALFEDGVIVGVFLIPFGIFLILWMRYISKKEDEQRL